MNFNDHSKLKGLHALLGASKYHWLNYDNEKLVDYFSSQAKVARGTALHEIAKDLIDNRVKLSKQDRHLIQFELLKKGINPAVIDPDEILETLLPYVNDALGFRMTAEQILYYSEYCFGTADTIYYSELEKVLRIHDLKTGEGPVHMEQLLIYAALFCLEYKIRPGDIQIELRIYQSGGVQVMNPTAEDILPIMDKIVASDKLIRKIK